MRMRFCAGCDEGVAYGRSRHCGTCRKKRHRERSLARYHRLRHAINAERRGKQAQPTPEQRNRQNVLKRAYERAGTEAEIDALLAAWGERPRQRRAARQENT